ncbi:MAG: ribonuclease P protein component [Bacteroidia bacterium]|nr:ribonuclease P protein component [Bacteroidia bacterium]
MQLFKKQERLCSKLSIDLLLEKGKSFNVQPFKIVWQLTESSTTPAKVLISVPKRNFKKAVDRNKLKRRIREAYRKNKESYLYNLLNGKRINIMFVYIAKEQLEYKEIELKIKESLQRLSNSIKN